MEAPVRRNLCKAKGYYISNVIDYKLNDTCMVMTLYQCMHPGNNKYSIIIHDAIF